MFLTMSAKYRISVLMGIYNCASTLQEALDSLYAQTYQGFKIILCDDGSTDGTYAVAEEYASKHDNIVLTRNDRNRGLNYTLNHCLEYADTEYCARMDGDDISLPTRFEKEMNFLDGHKEYDIVSCGMEYFDEKGVFGRTSFGNEIPTKETFAYTTPHCHAPCMVRTEAYKAVGGYTVDKRLLRNEDYNLWMKMYAIGLRGYNIPEHLYAVRDDRKAVGRRNVRCRLNSIYSVTLAYRTLHFSFFGYVRNVMEQLLKIMAPTFIYNHFHRKRLNSSVNK